jgi:hypothetical protein
MLLRILMTDAVVVHWVLPLMRVGMTETSMIRNPSIPCTSVTAWT